VVGGESDAHREREHKDNSVYIILSHTREIENQPSQTSTDRHLSLLRQPLHSLCDTRVRCTYRNCALEQKTSYIYDIREEVLERRKCTRTITASHAWFTVIHERMSSIDERITQTILHFAILSTQYLYDLSTPTDTVSPAGDY